jgi:hypothetical protein
MKARFSLIPALAVGIGAVTPATADPAPFELSGPDLHVEVTRGERTLPIGKVPSLAVGDKVVVRGAFPADQGANFLLVSAFLRGAANPPPKNWIAHAQTWKTKEKDKALSLTVPAGARQAVLLLVPQTGGADGALVDAVRGKPGEFVRASQDLNQASLDHSRLTAFLSAIQSQDDTGPEALRTVAPVLARSLSIKLQEDCLSKVIEQQASCLVQNKDTLVLGDVHSSTLADTLTGTPTDLALQLSATREAGAGYYSAYIGVARDIARIFGAFSNPEFNYLPTLTLRHDETMALLLNAAPSFKKPKSVMVAALPAIEADVPPQLRSTAKGAICAAKPGTVLPVEGAPLIFSTDFAHAMTARLTSASGQTVEVPVVARADKGGYVLGAEALPAAFTGTIRAHVHGQWGFVPFDGPDFLLERPDAAGWKVAGDGGGLVVGRDNEVMLEGAAPSCVGSIAVRRANGPARPVTWKPQAGGRLAVTVPLADAPAGELTLEVHQQGVAEPATLVLDARVQASRLDALELHAGDNRAVLTGQRLDQVRSVSLGAVEFAPDGLTREGAVDRLQLVVRGEGRVPDQVGAAKAMVALQDGRSLALGSRIAGPRPHVELLSRTVYPGAQAPGILPIDLGPGDLLPENGEIVFSVKAGAGTQFGAQDRVEVAPAGADAAVRLSAGRGLALESAQVAVATLKAADLAPGTAGSLRFRVVHSEAGQGEVAGDWQPLATLVRLPRLENIACHNGTKAGDNGTKPESNATQPADGCTVTGRNLFLIDTVSADAAFTRAAAVAPGFTGATMTVPAATDGRLYLRLRDAPASAVSVAVKPAEAVSRP